MRFVRRFRDVGLGDVASVGGKNASLGELIAKLTPLGVSVPTASTWASDTPRSRSR